MEPMSAVVDAIYARLGSVEHVEQAPGDFIADGLVHCGICGTAKEYRLPSGRYVHCICECRIREIAEEEAERERQREEAIVRELAEYSLVDERFRESTFDRYDAQTDEDRRIKRMCMNYVERFDECYVGNVGLIFYGAPGTGKTFAASCIANALMARRVPVLVTSIVRLTAGRFGDDLNEILNRMNTARLLVLDDFGAERNTDFKAEQIFSVIDARYAAKRPMIITTNLTDFKTDPDVRRRRIYDRIFEVCQPIKMDGESKRKAAGVERRKDVLRMLEG